MTALEKASNRLHLPEIIWLLDHNLSTIKIYKQVAFPTQKVERMHTIKSKPDIYLETEPFFLPGS